MKKLILVLLAVALQKPSSPEIEVSGLQKRVNVSRDSRGIPYIEAANEHDLYFAQGYITASDRLWQMDLLRRTGRGELAEILGQAAVEQDRRHRTFGFGPLADSLVTKLNSPIRASLQAYADGVNAYIKSLTPSALPLEFRILQYSPTPWLPGDTLVIGKIFAETLSTTFPSDLMRSATSSLPADVRRLLFPVTSPLDVLVFGSDSSTRQKRDQAAAAGADFFNAYEDRDARAASNNWVVSGKRTVTGKPLLANDPHLAASAPSIWYLVHLSMPGMRVAGVTTPGLPGVTLGHNDRIAWGATNLEADVQDLYIESTEAGTVRHEEIKVRGAASVGIDITVTRHGPIIVENDGRRYSLRWTSLQPDASELPPFYAINRARNWKEFREALRSYPGPTQNFIYADVDGHIGFYGAGRIPIRKTGDGSLPYNGTTDEGEWIGYIPFDDLPHVYDPPSGVIVTANQRDVGLDYRYHLTNEWNHPNRARRIFDLIQSKPKLSAEDFRTIQADTYSVAGMTFAQEVAKLVPGLLPSWDGRVDADSRGALMIAAMRNAMRSRILTGVGGADLARQYTWQNDPFIDQIITARPPALLPKEFKDYSELIRASHQDAQATLRQRLGENENDWTWGRFAQVRFPHPLATVPGAGQAFTIPPFPQNGGNSLGPGATVNVGANVSMRLIADPANWDQTLHGISLGESGDPMNPHWRDQLDDWRAVTPKPFPFSPEAVQKAAVNEVVLVP
jgi:penicillin amidase